MLLRDIIGHRRLTTLLARAIERESLPPTLLFAGPSGIGKWAVPLLLGSVAERVVWTAPCPVLTVHATERDFIAPDALASKAKT